MAHVTLAIAAYNGEPYYPTAIESLLEQTYRDLEVVLVVDRASADNTVAIAHEYADKDDRVRVIEVDHCSIPSKFARVVDEATSEWIGFLDSDDVALPHRVARCLAAAEQRPDVVGWFGWSGQIGPDGSPLRTVRHGPTTDEEFRALRRAHDIPIFDHGTSLMRRQALLAAGNYDPAMTVTPDTDIVDRVCDVGVMLTIPEPLSLYRLHGSNHSYRNFTEQSRQTLYLWERRAAIDRGDPFPSYPDYINEDRRRSAVEEWSFMSRERSRYHWGVTAVHWACHRRGRAVVSAAQSILWNPRSVVNRMWRNYLRPRLHERRQVVMHASGG